MHISSALLMICLIVMPMFAVIHAVKTVKVTVELKGVKKLSIYQAKFLERVHSSDKLQQLFKTIVSTMSADYFYESVIEDCIIYNVSNSEELAQSVNQSVRSVHNIITPDSAALTIIAGGERLLNDYKILNEDNMASKANEYANRLEEAAEMEEKLDARNCVILITFTANAFLVSSGVDLNQYFPTLVQYYNDILSVVKYFC